MDVAILERRSRNCQKRSSRGRWHCVNDDIMAQSSPYTNMMDKEWEETSLHIKDQDEFSPSSTSLSFNSELKPLQIPYSTRITMAFQEAEQSVPVSSMEGNTLYNEETAADCDSESQIHPPFSEVGELGRSISIYLPLSTIPHPLDDMISAFPANALDDPQFQKDIFQHRCSKCDKTFRRPGDLRKHEKIHVDPQDREHGCGICGRRFYY